MKELCLQEFQSICLENHTPFVSFRLPNKLVETYLSDKNNIINFTSFKEIEKHKGFIFSSFTTKIAQPNILIKPTKIYRGNTFTCELSNIKINEFTKIEKKKVETTTKNAFLKNVESILENINTNVIKKVVLSRTKVFKNFEVHLLPKFYKQLLYIYRNALVYFLYIPDRLLWIGASPELFLENNKYNYHTIALAGTTKSDKRLSKILWNKKEITEQEIVFKYILNILQKHEVKRIKVKKRQSYQMGDIFHLQKDIFFTTKTYTTIPNLITSLHPSPAICGVPKTNSLQLIKQLETHDREYYCGIVGKWNTIKKMNLYINLRCLQHHQDELILYAGCGITNKSIPGKEWQETSDKLALLESIIQKIKWMKSIEL